MFCVFYFIKISKFALPGVMLIYERTSKDRKKRKGLRTRLENHKLYGFTSCMGFYIEIRGVQLFPGKGGGFKHANFYIETHTACDFQGGSVAPIPPPLENIELPLKPWKISFEITIRHPL